MHYLKLFSQVKSTQDEKVRFIKGLSELFSFLFLRVFIKKYFLALKKHKKLMLNS